MDRSQVMIMPGQSPIVAQNAGLFISQGRGRHPDRIIDSYELIFVAQGTLGMYEAEETFTLAAGHSLLLSPDRRHGGTADYPPDLRFYWIHFSLRDHSDGMLHVPQTTAVAFPERLAELYRKFLDDQESGYADPLTGGLLVMLMLCEVARETHEMRTGPGLVLAQRAHGYIRTNLTRPLSTSSIATTLDCHPDYLGRVFSSIYGLTVTEAIHRQRIARACALLLDSGQTITQIAHACGFEDPGYFRRLFHRAKGLSPNTYRRLYARMHINSE